MNDTRIQWTDASWNPITGCDAVSPGCANCYAAQLAATRLAETPRYKGLAVINESGRGVWTGKIRLQEDKLEDPVRKKKPKKIFVCDMSDLFHKGVPEEFIDRVWWTMERAKHHTFQVLTKRIDRARHYLDHKPGRMLPNVWVGTSVENQQTADERLESLAKIQAVVRFISFEPLLEDVTVKDMSRFQWAIIGGESAQGGHARPCDLAWVRSLLGQCRRDSVACFVKQLGSLPYHTFRNGLNLENAWLKGVRDFKGGKMEEWPADIRVREFPFVRA